MIDPKIAQSYREYMKKCYSKVDSNWESTCYEMFSIKRVEEEIEIIEKLTGKTLDKNKILEIGSGNGLFLALTRKEGVISYGIEPDFSSLNAYRNCIKLFDIQHSPIVCAIGENLPFGKNIFDLVCSFYTLEHCTSPYNVLQESIRVLKKGGHIVFIIPNYGSIYEGHYRIPWIPYMPKFIARIWVSFFHRNPSLLDSLNFLNAFSVFKIIQDNERITVYEKGYEIWKNRLLSNNLGAWSHSALLLRKISDLIHKMKLTKIICFLGRLLKFYTPIILVIRKN